MSDLDKRKEIVPSLIPLLLMIAPRVAGPLLLNHALSSSAFVGLAADFLLPVDFFAGFLGVSPAGAARLAGCGKMIAD